MNLTKKLTALLLLLCLLFSTTGCLLQPGDTPPATQGEYRNPGANPNPLDPADLPAYDGQHAYLIIQDNRPDFTEEEMVRTAFEYYAPLDALGRCTYTVACLGKSLMPNKDRDPLYAKPSGWHTVKYDIVSGKYLYNRCHLIGYQLAGENNNDKNLITGTRYLNITGMVGFENMVADYIKETGNHVLYRVTPIFVGDELLARGVQMEAYSVEDRGAGICFHIYAYNVQPGITIDYATGESWLTGETPPPAGDNTGEGGGSTAEETQTYVLNTATHKFHLPTCSSVSDMADTNREDYTGTRAQLIEDGYEPCGRCKP